MSFYCSARSRPQLSLCLHVNPKMREQGLLRGCCQDGTIVQQMNERIQGKWKDQASGFIYNLVRSGAEEKGDGQAFCCWTALGFYYGPPSYRVALQKEIFGSPCFNRFCSFQRKTFTASGSNLRGGFPVGGERSGASSGRGAASAPLPDVRTSPSSCSRPRARDAAGWG